MNYIKQLEYELRRALARIERYEQELRNYHSQLSYDAKFSGVDDDGDRKDWVATRDVTYRIETILTD